MGFIHVVGFPESIGLHHTEMQQRFKTLAKRLQSSMIPASFDMYVYKDCNRIASCKTPSLVMGSGHNAGKERDCEGVQRSPSNRP